MIASLTDVRVRRMERLLRNADAQVINTEGLRHQAGEELKRFLEIRSQVFDLMAEADRIAAITRQKATS